LSSNEKKILVLLLTFYSYYCSELGSLIQRYLALLIARLQFAKNVPEYEGSFALDCYAKALREQRQKLKIGDPTSPIRFVIISNEILCLSSFSSHSIFSRKQVVVEMLDIQQLGITLMQQMLDIKQDSINNEVVWCCTIPVLNDLVASYLVIQYCLAKLSGK
jgi:hypothetical protein